MSWWDRSPADAAQEIAAWVAARGDPGYRARQIGERLWQRPVAAWHDATELPRTLQDALTSAHPVPRPVLAARQASRDGTVKYLWRFADGAAVESVLIPEGRRRTLCVSSQAGCAFACAFCATGLMGFGRHLRAGEIAIQVREVVLDPEAGRPTNVVFMGMGEPLHNWPEVDVALSILNHPGGVGLGARHLTVSTVGLVPGLRQLARRPEQFRVAWSLHSPFTERRAALMPVERKYPVRTVVDALRAFPRRVTLEYVMIAGYNDGTDDARELAGIARDLTAHVNLLPLHPGGNAALTPTPRKEIAAFAAELRRLGANVTVRRSRGLDIAAACGQLRVTLDRRGVRPEQDGEIQQEVGVGLRDDAAEP
jgi:23S rRNA (adenine2503-C2)-methyltransferase